tara:strand:- start:294 stop:458 length:165 start_codon:yes stop_codon:yes gene_type:complete
MGDIILVLWIFTTLREGVLAAASRIPPPRLRGQCSPLTRKPLATFDVKVTPSNP